MGRIVIAAFRAHEGKEDQLLQVLEERMPLMRRLGLATERQRVTMRSRDGTIIDVSEWTSAEAICKAHETPEVLELWQKFDACCDYVKLDSLSEVGEDFATFEALES